MVHTLHLPLSQKADKKKVKNAENDTAETTAVKTKVNESNEGLTKTNNSQLLEKVSEKSSNVSPNVSSELKGSPSIKD